MISTFSRLFDIFMSVLISVISSHRLFLLCLALSPKVSDFLSTYVSFLVSGFCLLVLACLYLVKSFSSISTGRDGHEPIPESKPVPVTCHEISTQTDAISASAEKQTTDVSTNPFETEGVSDAERTDHPETDQTDTKTIDETGDKSGKDKTTDP